MDRILVVRELKGTGGQLDIRYGFHPTPFGECLAATTTRGLCGLDFCGKENRGQALALLKEKWKDTSLVEDPEATRPVVEKIFNPAAHQGTEPIKVLLKGTSFQLKVWEALLRIPPGTTTSYSALADAIGKSGASRAVGTAVGRNPVGYLIPCHRIIRADGKIGGYKWGVARKRAILAMEASDAGP